MGGRRVDRALELGLKAALLGLGVSMLVMPPSAATLLDHGPDCTIVGTHRNDVLRGTAGNDVICGGNGADVLIGLGGNDILRGDGGNDLMRGGPGNDTLRAEPGNDRMFGGSGNDRLGGGAGSDLLAAGSGFDTITYRSSTKGVTVTIGAGKDDGAAGEKDDVRKGVEVLVGSRKNDTLVGTSGDETLRGLGGSDRLVGKSGNDRLFGGPGQDAIDAIDGASFVDKVFCGTGPVDLVQADDQDEVSPSCKLNKAPTDVRLVGSSVPENKPSGTTVGTLSATDPDAGDTHTFALVTGAGDADNASFKIAGDKLQTAEPLDFEAKPTRSVRIAASDGRGGNFAKAFTVTVTDEPGDIAPVAVDDTAAVVEDDPAAAVDVLANDTDIDGGAKFVDTVTQPARGTVVITGGGTGLTYAPDANECGTDPFTYTLNGGSTATVSVTVTCVDDAPTAVDDSITVAEDSGAGTVDVLTNDTDADGGPKAVTAVTQGANGAVLNNGVDVDYTPDADYCGPDSFTYTITGGSTATVSVTVTCVDDAPIAVDDTTTVGEDDTGAVIEVLANDTDIDGGPKAITALTQPDNGTVVNNGANVSYTPDTAYCNTPPGTTLDTFTYTLNGGSSATVAVTVACDDIPPVADDDSATVSEDAGATVVDVLANDTNPDGIGPIEVASVTQPDNGTVVNNGTDVSYAPDANYCNNPPGTSPDTFTYTLNGGSTATVSVTANCVDDAPVAVNDSATVAEDSSSNVVDVLANDTDVDGGPRTVEAVTQPANGTVVNNGADVSYAPNGDYCGPDSFTYTLNGGSTATVSITVTCTADSPVVNTSPGSASYTENTPATAIDPNVTVTHSDADGTITSGSVAITTNFAAEDVLALGGVHPEITATLSGNTLTLSGTATPAAYQAALRDVTYHNTSEGPSTLVRTVTFAVTDSSALSGSDTRSIAVTGVNDTPDAVADSSSTDEDTTLTFVAPGVLANDTDVDPGDTMTVTELNDLPVLSGSSDKGASVTINANGSFSYNPGSSFQGLSTGESDTDTFTYTMSDAAGAEDSATVTITISGVSDAPTAEADSFDAVGNTGLFVGMARPAADAGKEISGSVLANDTDPDTLSADLVAEPVTNAPTALGGTVTIEADGNFTYHPDDADTGVTDTFTYRVCDASPCNAGTVSNATGTLSLPIAGQVWYVRNNQAAGGDGTSDTPFDTILEAEAAGGAGDTVYVFDGADTTTNLDTGIVLEAGQRLIGETRPLDVDLDGPGGVPPTPLHPGNAASVPTLTASGEDVVSLAAGTVVDGFIIDPSGNGGGIAAGPGAGGAAAGNVTVARVTVSDTGTAGTQPGVELDGTTGTNTFSGVSVTTTGAVGVRVNNAGTVDFDADSIATTGAKGLDAAATNMASSSFGSITVTGSGSGGVRLNNTTGQTVLGDGAGDDLLLSTTSGVTAALDVAGAGNVQVAGAGTDTISATGGPAVDIRNSLGSVFDFDSVSSTNSANDGINLDTNGTSPFSAATGTITGAAGIAVDVNGSGGDVSYGGALQNGAGQTAEITGRDGGAVMLSGAIADSSDTGGGIVVSGNTAGTTTFSNASKVLNTGAAAGVLMTGNGSPTTGHLVSFTGGGLDIDTTSGQGFSATGGRLTIGGTGNSISTTTGTGLSVEAAGITAENLNLQSVSTDGAPNGIRLNGTGTNGRLIVTGSGGVCTLATTAGCTGGQIANGVGADDAGATPAGTGVVLNDTLNPSLTRLWIHDHSNYGIRGTNVAGFTMADSVISGTNGTSELTAHKDGSARFVELTGTVAMTNVAISGGHFTNLMVDNTAGVLNGTFDNVDSGTIHPTGGDDAVQFEGIGTASMNVDYKNSSITTASGDLFQYIGDGSGGGNLDFTGNTLTNNEPSINTGGGGVALVAGAKGAATMDVLNNTMRDSLTNALTVIKSADATAGTNDLVANISNNSIGVAGIENSGSAEGDGMEITTFGDGHATFDVTNNNIRQYNSSGIHFVAGSGVAGTGQLNLNVSGNSVGNPGTNPLITLLQGIRVDSGVDAGDTFATCVKFGANAITGSSDAPSKDFRLVASQGTTLRQPGYGGAATDGTAFASYAAGLIGGGAQGTAVASPPGTFTGTGTTCP